MKKSIKEFVAERSKLEVKQLVLFKEGKESEGKIVLGEIIALEDEFKK